MDIATHHHDQLVILLSDLLLFFGISGLLVPILQRLKLSPVLGYLASGVLIGPSGLALFSNEYDWLEFFSIGQTETVQILGELGIIALLFMIGLELSLRRLMELKRYVLGLGSLQIVITAAVIAGIASIFDNSPEAAILLGASLALSSTAIVMQLLDEHHLSNRPLGVKCFSILLMQDLAVVPILIMVSAFSGGADQKMWSVLLESLVLATVVVVLIYVLGKKLLRPLMNAVSFMHNAEWLAAFVVFMVMAIALLTQSAGLSAALGAFLAGLLISETEYRHEVEIIIEPLKNLLLGIFFLSIGMMIDVREIVNNPYWIVASVVGIFMLKAVILYPMARFFGVNKNQSAQLSIMMSQPGEFAFLILSFALAAQLIPLHHGQFFLLVTAVAMLISPVVFKLAPTIARVIDRQGTVSNDVLSEDEGGHVILVGFGRIGQMIGTVLEHQRIPYVAIDADIHRVREMQKEGLNVIYGDARRTAQWRSNMRADTATSVVIAIDNPDIAKDILLNIKHHWSHLAVFMRAKDVNAMRELYDLGVKQVVPEALESSLQLARGVMEHTGVEEDQLEDILNRCRVQATLSSD